MHPVLMRAVVEAIAFASLSAEDEINPDVAVAHLEQLAVILKVLPPAERRSLDHFSRALADAEERSSGPSERGAVLRNLASSLRLLGDDALIGPIRGPEVTC